MVTHCVVRCSSSCVAEESSRPCVCAKQDFLRVTRTSCSGMVWDSRSLCLMRSATPSILVTVSKSLWPNSMPGALRVEHQCLQPMRNLKCTLAGAFNSANPSFSSVLECLRRLKMNAVSSFRRMPPNCKQSSVAMRHAPAPPTGRRLFASWQLAGWCKPSGSTVEPSAPSCYKPQPSVLCAAGVMV